MTQRPELFPKKFNVPKNEVLEQHMGGYGILNQPKRTVLFYDSRYLTMSARANREFVPPELAPFSISKKAEQPKE